MRVIKRDGRTVEYDRNKILIAIRKANAEVDTFERVNDDMIDGIVAGIENMKRDTMQVEDIQDMIEQKRQESLTLRKSILFIVIRENWFVKPIPQTIRL